MSNTLIERCDACGKESKTHWMPGQEEQHKYTSRLSSPLRGLYVLCGTCAEEALAFLLRERIARTDARLAVANG